MRSWFHRQAILLLLCCLGSLSPLVLNNKQCRKELFEQGRLAGSHGSRASNRTW
jgi:hypothetical protein